MLKRLPKKPDDNFRLVPVGTDGHGMTYATTRRDFMPPIPVGSYVVTVFRVVGYTPDCDGSAMAQLEQVDMGGEPTGWEAKNIGLYENTDLVIDHPSELLSWVGQ